MSHAPTELLVCIKCRRGQEIPEDEQRPGERLLADLSGREMPEGVRLRAVECLQNCDSGCSVACAGATAGLMCSGMSMKGRILT